MTRYETFRVVLHFSQVVATVSIPIVAVIISEHLRKKREIAAKYKYKYKYIDKNKI